MDSIQADIEAAYRRESRRVLATLLRLLNGHIRCEILAQHICNGSGL